MKRYRIIIEVDTDGSRELINECAKGMAAEFLDFEQVKAEVKYIATEVVDTSLHERTLNELLGPF